MVGGWRGPGAGTAARPPAHACSPHLFPLCLSTHPMAAARARSARRSACWATRLRRARSRARRWAGGGRRCCPTCRCRMPGFLHAALCVPNNRGAVPFHPPLQVDADQLKKILAYCDRGQQEGARLLCGGKQKGTKGYYVRRWRQGGRGGCRVLCLLCLLPRCACCRAVPAVALPCAAPPSRAPPSPTLLAPPALLPSLLLLSCAGGADRVCRRRRQHGHRARGDLRPRAVSRRMRLLLPRLLRLLRPLRLLCAALCCCVSSPHAATVPQVLPLCPLLCLRPPLPASRCIAKYSTTKEVRRAGGCLLAGAVGEAAWRRRRRVPRSPPPLTPTPPTRPLQDPPSNHRHLDLPVPLTLHCNPSLPPGHRPRQRLRVRPGGGHHLKGHRLHQHRVPLPPRWNCVV